MPMPKSKTTRSKRGMRRSHHGISNPAVSLCPQCDALIRPHRVCKECGYYHDKEVMAPKD